MEKWKAKYASHFPTPSTAERYRQNSLRYTNYPTGTKDRARQYAVTSLLVPPISLLISYWMIGCYFMGLKRFSELNEIGDRGVAGSYRASFKRYTPESLLVSVVFYASTAMLFFGAFIIRYRIELILGFPLVALVMAIYFRLAFKPESSVQNPEKLYREPALMGWFQ